MVIEDLLSAGFGLTLDTCAERQSAKDQKTLPLRDVPHNAGGVSNSTRKKEEFDALKELKSYADFQKSLSDTILDGLARVETATSARSLLQVSHTDNSQHSLESEDTPWSQARKSALLRPVVIPQGNGDDNEHAWPRTYVSALMDSGIDEQALLAFIDSFNESLILSPRLDVVNMATLAPGIRGEISCFDSSTVIPVAIRLAKHAKTDMSTNKVIIQANTMLFRPRGLFAMIATSLPDFPLQNIVVNSENQLHKKQQKKFSGTDFGHDHTGISAGPLSFQDKPTSLPNLKLRQMSNFITDYSERRPVFQRGADFQSHIYEPHTNASTSSNMLQKNLTYRKGPLSAFVSSITNRHDNKKTHKRRERKSGMYRQLEPRNGMLRASAEPVSKGPDSPICIREASEAKVTETSDMVLHTGINSRDFSYEDYLETAPPAYDLGTQSDTGRSAFGI
ncbi:hypothetical protein BKA64DRAFT_719041 [Cadophora sp. MPI-SDFR-AT-0126]|nr:hypothetical protein BKA64DRAFT_719041 [Leotiomycetes sp. MPI-SDFR-AT-0126]